MTRFSRLAAAPALAGALILAPAVAGAGFLPAAVAHDAVVGSTPEGRSGPGYRTGSD
jgi:hypothetical protein